MAEQNFVDYVKIHCTSGDGGAGSVHFYRDPLNARGGPDGGDGGRGGHIILKGNKQMWTLLHFRYKKHVKAKHGGRGGGGRKTGADGEDVIFEVPLGTIVKDVETGEKLFEITDHGEEYIIAKGGKGGRGNVHFKTSTRQTPQYAQPGIPGFEGWLILELKLLADVGLVGFPNAGKSTLLSVISAAKPKIANYAFTTLKPNLGIVPYRGDLSFVMADIPGIIEDAHKGKGLGLRFLRHIERNSALLFVIAADEANINEQFKTLYNELEKYNPELLYKPKLLAISKSDMLDDELKTMLEENLDVPIPHIFISSISQVGIMELKDALWGLLNAEM